MKWGLLVAVFATMGLRSGCYVLRPSSGGAQATAASERKIDSADIALPAGYRIEAVARGLAFPTGAAFDEQGRLFVTESGYSYGEVWTTPRLVRIENGQTTVVA